MYTTFGQLYWPEIQKEIKLPHHLALCGPYPGLYRRHVEEDC